MAQRVKDLPANAGDIGLISGLGGSPGEKNCNPLQYSGPENFMDCVVYGVAKSWTRLSDFHSLRLKTKSNKMTETTKQLQKDGSDGQESACQWRRCRRCGFSPWVGKIPWRRAWQPTPVFLPGEYYRQRSLAGYNPQDHKESDMTE